MLFQTHPFRTTSAIPRRRSGARVPGWLGRARPSHRLSAETDPPAPGQVAPRARRARVEA